MHLCTVQVAGRICSLMSKVECHISPVRSLMSVHNTLNHQGSWYIGYPPFPRVAKIKAFTIGSIHPSIHPSTLTHLSIHPHWQQYKHKHASWKPCQPYQRSQPSCANILLSKRIYILKVIQSWLDWVFREIVLSGIQ